MPAKGEYLVTTRKPSFVWYGKISMFPGLFFTAQDYYVEGKGNMRVRMPRDTRPSAYPLA